MINEDVLVDRLFRKTVKTKDNDAKLSQLSVDKLSSFPNHPFKVLDDEDMELLTESVKENNIMSPLIVRPKENITDEYEVISGHRRLHAAKKAGLKTVPALIYDIDRNTAAAIVVDSNLHREHVLPSEKAFAYKMKYEALQHQGTSSQLGTKLRTDAEMAMESGDSRNQIQRYIRLTYLIPEILQKVDDGKVAFNPAVEISYLYPEKQQMLLDAMSVCEATPSHAQAITLKKLSQSGELTEEKITEILSELKPNQQEHIRFKASELKSYFPKGYTDEQMKQDIIKGLELLKRQRQRSGVR